jgi:MoxR-like ATPase
MTDKTSPDDVAAVQRCEKAYNRVRDELSKVIVGQNEVIEQVLIAMFARGHALLEGVPGLAKTLLISSLAKSLHLTFKRIQFTPDLMPSDVTGTEVIQEDTQTRQRAYRFLPGPIFANLLLADEINRTPPKTQAALLEAMQERRITLDGKAHPLSERFMVVATENPIEQQGTYPLPEAQLDRFLFKHVLGYPSEDEERAIVAATGASVRMPDPAALGVEPVISREMLGAAIAAVAEVTLTAPVVDYIVRIVRATRVAAGISHGASPRSAAMLATAARARAALDGRDYVIPDDAKALAIPALRHRIILSPAAEIDGRRVEDVIAEVVTQTEVPR